MKLKRTLILTLAFTFLVSTTGLPVFYHYCEMMKKKSLSECQDCSEEKEETFSCYALEEPDYRIQFKTESSNCCIDEFEYKKIEDDFLSNKTDINFYYSFETLFQPIALISKQTEYFPGELFYNDSSPPFLINPYKYITNSALLI
jgi:hypothetical protein